MRLLDIDGRAVRNAVAALGDSFRTKDVSRQVPMLDAHGDGGGNYHAIVGRYLSENRSALGIRLVTTSSGDRGALWEKSAGTRTGAPTRLVPMSRQREQDMRALGFWPPESAERTEPFDPTSTDTTMEGRQSRTAADTTMPGRQNRTTTDPDGLRPTHSSDASRESHTTSDPYGLRATHASDAARQSHTTSDPADVGPQYAGDKPFTAQMRRHQSWYRAHVLGVPCGTGPKPADVSRYGNMLRRDDGARGLNFLTPGIHEAARRRLSEGGGAVEPFRLLHNMLSSQPMCFNLFAPLADDLALATRLLAALLPGEVARVRMVAIEWAPSPAAEFLGDRTAFDAFITYEQPDGRLAFVGVETKLTEPFSQKDYDGASYRRWTEQAESPWPREAWGSVSHADHNQLWRDHLLAWALLQKQPQRFAAGRLMLVRHPLDRSCEGTVRRYRELLRPGDTTFVDMPLDRLSAAWREVLPHSEWLDAFDRRYLDLRASELD